MNIVAYVATSIPNNLLSCRSAVGKRQAHMVCIAISLDSFSIYDSTAGKKTASYDCHLRLV